MHKGFIIILLALFLVAILTSGLYLYINPQTLKNFPFQFSFQIFPSTKSESLISAAPVTSEPVSLSLNLSSPDNNLLVFDDDLLISGKTSPNTLIILSLDEKDLAINTEASGNFSHTLKLQEGVNNFTVTAFDTLGNSKSEKRIIYYSEEKL